MRSALDLTRQLSALVTVVGTGVDTLKFRLPTSEERDLARSSLGLKDGELTIFVPGSLAPHKGILKVKQLADLIASAEAADVRIVIAHARTGGSRGFFEQSVIRLLDMPCVSYLGGLSHDRMVLGYWSADAVLLPYTGAEGLSRSALEAMACGCHIVATNVPGMPIQDGVTGTLVSVAASSDEILEACIDRRGDGRNQFGPAAAAQIASSYGRQGYLGRLERALTEL
jgi:glycosyltransferase involved in cell wall biosynthesis